jgi:hypothetical protein
VSATDPTLDEALKSIQLEHAQLELQKLKEELIQLKKGKTWYEAVGQTAGLLTVLVAALGFWFGIYQYAHQQRENRAAQALQFNREKDTLERELMKPWLENQRSIYLRALAAAATIANTDDQMKRKAVMEEFWTLYHGQMVLVETKSVSGGMVKFGNCLNGLAVCDRAEMNSRSRALATAMAESMGGTARMTFAEFVANQFQYSAGP